MIEGRVVNINNGNAYIKSKGVKKDVFCPKEIVGKKKLSVGDYVEFNLYTSKDNKGDVKYSVDQKKDLKIVGHPLFVNALRILDLSSKEYDAFCNSCREYVNEKDFKENVTTSKLRNIFSRVKSAKSVRELKTIRPKLAYLAGREPKVRYFMQDLSTVIERLSNDDEVESFKDFFEAIICYNKETAKSN